MSSDVTGKEQIFTNAAGDGSPLASAKKLARSLRAPVWTEVLADEIDRLNAALYEIANYPCSPGPYEPAAYLQHVASQALGLPSRWSE